MTRTFVFGEPSEKLREVHDTVRRANEAARKLVAPGVRFCDIDAAARSIIEEAGYGSYFTHRLGHQIGLDVHEPGDVSAAHDAPVQAGMVFSIEPGIYLPASSACASRTSCWSPKTAAKCSTATPASWFRSASAKKSPGWFLQRECGRFA